MAIRRQRSTTNISPSIIITRRGISGIGSGIDSSNGSIQDSDPTTPPLLNASYQTLIPGHGEYVSPVVTSSAGCENYSFVQFAGYWFDDEPINEPKIGNEMKDDNIRDLWTQVITNMVLNSLRDSKHQDGSPICIDVEDQGVDAPLTAQDMSLLGYRLNSTRFNKFPYVEDRQVRPLSSNIRHIYETPASEALPRAAHAIREVTRRVLEEYPNSPVGWYNVGLNVYIPGEEGINTQDIPVLNEWMGYLKGTQSYDGLYTKDAFDFISYCFIPIYPSAGNQWANPAFAGKHYYKRYTSNTSKLGNLLDTLSQGVSQSALKYKLVPGFTSRWIFTASNAGSEQNLVDYNKTWSEVVTTGDGFAYNDATESPYFDPINTRFEDYTQYAEKSGVTQIPMLPREAEEFYGWLGYKEQKDWQSLKPRQFGNLIWAWWDGDIMPSTMWKGKEITWIPRVAWQRGTLESNFRSGNINDFMRWTLGSGYTSYLNSNIRPFGRPPFHPDDLVWFDRRCEIMHGLFHGRGDYYNF